MPLYAIGRLTKIFNFLQIDPFKEMSYKELECIKEQIRKVLESGGEYKQKVSKSTMH
jgi:hypothetical protein